MHSRISRNSQLAGIFVRNQPPMLIKKWEKQISKTCLQHIPIYKIEFYS